MSRRPDDFDSGFPTSPELSEVSPSTSTEHLPPTKGRSPWLLPAAAVLVLLLVVLLIVYLLK